MIDDSIFSRRPAQPSDADIIVRWFPTRTEATLWGGPLVPDPLTAAWLAEQFKSGSYWVWIDQEKELSGVFGFVFPEDRLVHLTRFALSPRLRGRGLAKSLIAEIISLARSTGADKLSLGVYGSNHIAKHLYDGFGFQAFGERIAPEDASGVSVKMRIEL